MRKAKRDNWRYSIVDIEQDALEASAGDLNEEDDFSCCGINMCCGVMYPFEVVNWVAVFGHFCSFLFMFILYPYDTPFEIPYTETYIKWNQLKNVTGNETCAPSLGRINTTDPEEDFCIGVITDTIPDSGVNLGILIIAFHVLSFLFQGLAGLSMCFTEGIGVWSLRFRYTTEISKGRNLLRFVEYGFSASIMLVAIALLNGVTDINLIACIAVLTAATQIAGLVCEYLLAKDDDDGDWLVAVVLHLIAWMQFFCAYGVIMHAFLRSATQDENIRPPDFVYAIVLAIFAFYAVFGMVQVAELCCYKSRLCNTCNDNRSCRVGGPKKIRDNDGNLVYEDGKVKREPEDVTKYRINYQCKEMTYVTLSLASKLVLGWLIFTNFLFRS